MPRPGPRSSSLNPFITLDSDGHIATPLPCHNCGYLLVGQNTDAKCPECGVSIPESMRHGLPRFAPTHRLEGLSHASLALIIGWPLVGLFGLGVAVVIPASLIFLVGLGKLKAAMLGFVVGAVALLVITAGAALIAGFYFWEWWDSYSFWYGYSNISDGYYFALATVWLAASGATALINCSAARLAKICRWSAVVKTAWAATLVTASLGVVPVVGQLLEIFSQAGVFEVWWWAWEDALGSPTWWAVGAITVAQTACWIPLHRALRRLIAERMSESASAG